MKQSQIERVRELLRARVPAFSEAVAPLFAAGGLTWGGGFGVNGYIPNSSQIAQCLYELIGGLEGGSRSSGRLSVYATPHEDNPEVVGTWGISFEVDFTRYEDCDGLVEPQ